MKATNDMRIHVKMLVWEDGNGAVWITHNTGEYVMGRHGAKNAYEAARRFTSGTESAMDAYRPVC